ncbi:MAG: inositol monophosphatase [Candidatus Magasanikbacteria bacterium]|nr:inositol monophosphatase [Candidatus Magasanikbacteria bacterium]
MTKELNFTIDLVQKTGKTLLKHYKKDAFTIRGKSKAIKSKYDLLADEIIVKKIEKNFPKHSILSEESGLKNKKNEYIWLVDPIDGTGNYVNGNPFWSISVALWKNNEPIFGVIEAPILQERYIAIKNKGAWIIDTQTTKKQKAQVSSTEKLNNSYIVSCDGGSPRKKTINLYKKLYSKSKDMRKLGSAAIELAWVGTGRADIYATPKVNLWDIGAGVLFVKEAGGKIMDFNRHEYKWSDFKPTKKTDLLSTNGRVRVPKLSL